MGYVIVNARCEVIKLISNPRIPINARAVGEGINRNSRVAKQPGMGRSTFQST